VIVSLRTVGSIGSDSLRSRARLLRLRLGTYSASLSPAVGAALLARLAAAALAEAGELRMLVNDLVELAGDGRASFHIEDVRLDLVAERVASRAAGWMPGLRYELDLRPTLVRGDPDAVERRSETWSTTR
jgi:hypothetical protein